MSLGHSTVMAEVMYFGTPDGSGHEPAAALRSVLDRIRQLALNVSRHHRTMLAWNWCSI